MNMTRLKLQDDNATVETIPAPPVEAEKQTFNMQRGLHQGYSGAWAGDRYTTFGFGSADAALASSNLLDHLARDLHTGDEVAVAVYETVDDRKARKMRSKLLLLITGIQAATPDHGASVSYSVVSRHDFEVVR
jgi:hypothetical protein